MDIEAVCQKVLSKFSIEGELKDLTINRQGHINTTFVSTFEHDGKTEQYIHQKINDQVFTRPAEVMENIQRVTEHLSGKVRAAGGDPQREVLCVVKTRDGELFYHDEELGYWRTYICIPDITTYQIVSTRKQASLLGDAIGRFQLQLSDFDGSTLHETIYHFHDMRMRYSQLEKAMEVNYKGRLEKVKPEIEFLMENRERGYRIWDLFASGEVPNRVTHNDTKINNVLFSRDGEEAVCVIDLDTVMPGTILFDTGDMIRTATSTAEEDETDCSKMKCDYNLYEALVSAYLERADFLTEAERANVAESGRTITQIMAVRFLTDYLNGDHYYHIEREDHNLDRARTQIALMKDMDRQWGRLVAVTSGK